MEDKCPNCSETLITRTIKKKIGLGSIDYPIAQTCPKCKWSKDLTGAGDIVPTPVFQDENETKKPEIKPEIKTSVSPKPPSKTVPASPTGISKFIPIVLAILVVGAIGWVFFMNPVEPEQVDNSSTPAQIGQTPSETRISTPVPEVTATGKQIPVILETKRGIVPKTVTIKPGDEIVWTNDGTYAVTLVSSDGLFEDKFLNNLKRTSYVFKKPGTYGFYLQHDKNLAGTVVVEP